MLPDEPGVRIIAGHVSLRANTVISNRSFSVSHTLRRIALLALIPIVWGCGSSSSEGSGEDGTPPLEIAVVPKGTTHEFWKAIHAGAEKAAAEFGVEVIWQGPQKEDDRQLQIQVVQNLISRGVDAIVLAPLDSRSMARPVEAAVARGIPVVIIDSGLESDAQSSFIASNNYEGGRIGGKYLAEVIGGKGKVVLLRYQERGFLDALNEYAPDAELLIDNMYAGATMAKALQVSQNILNRFTEIDAIFTPNESATQGMLRALETSGRTGDVMFVGFDVNQILLDAMRDGTLHGLVVQDPVGMGYEGVKAAVSIVQGETIPERMDTRTILVTPFNIDDAEIQELLHPDFDRWLDN